MTLSTAGARRHFDSCSATWPISSNVTKLYHFFFRLLAFCLNNKEPHKKAFVTQIMTSWRWSKQKLFAARCVFECVVRLVSCFSKFKFILRALKTQVDKISYKRLDSGDNNYAVSGAFKGQTNHNLRWISHESRHTLVTMEPHSEISTIALSSCHVTKMLVWITMTVTLTWFTTFRSSCVTKWPGNAELAMCTVRIICDINTKKDELLTITNKLFFENFFRVWNGFGQFRWI